MPIILKGYSILDNILEFTQLQFLNHESRYLKKGELTWIFVILFKRVGEKFNTFLKRWAELNSVVPAIKYSITRAFHVDPWAMFSPSYSYCSSSLHINLGNPLDLIQYKHYLSHHAAQSQIIFLFSRQKQ